MPAFIPNKHLARSRYREMILADNPLWYFRLHLPKPLTTPYPMTDETGQYTGTAIQQFADVLVPRAHGLIRGDANTSMARGAVGWGGVNIPHETSLHPKGSMSVEAWFADWTDTRFTMIVSKDISGSQWPEFTLYFGSGTGTIGSTLYQTSGTLNSSTINSPLTYNDGNIHHAAMVFDTDQNLHMLYVDGELVASNPWTFSLYANTSSMTIGYQNNFPSAYNNATLDEVAFYHYPLTPGQIQHHYDVGMAIYRNYREVVKQAGPISYWRLGETVGNTAYDEMGVNDLVASNGPIVKGYASPMLMEDHNKSYCRRFNGSTTWLSTSGGSTGLNGLHTSVAGVCIECWMFPLSIGTFGVPVSSDNGTGGYGLYLRDTTAGGMRLAVIGRGGTPDVYETTNPIAIKQWSHVVVNYKFNSSCQIIIDGVDVGATRIFFGTSAGSDIGNNMVIGNNSELYSQPFDGYISDVAIYDRFLTVEEASQHYRESNIQLLKEGFYGFEPGNFFPGNYNPSWTIENANATWAIVDETVSTSKSLEGTTVVSSGECYITNKDIPQFSDGVITCECVHISGHTNNQPTILGRYIDANNCIHVRLAYSSNSFTIVELVGGSLTQSNVSYSFTSGGFGVRYYVEMIMEGTQVTANMYSDSDRSTLLATTTKTVTNAYGKCGIATIGQSTAKMSFDNFRVDILDKSSYSYRDIVLLDAPIRYYRLGEISTASAAVDEIDAANNGTYYLSPTLTEPSLIASDTNTSMRVHAPTIAGMYGPTLPITSGDFSVELWYRSTGPNASSGTLCSMYNNANGFYSSVLSGGQVRFDGKTSNGSYRNNQSTTTVDDGNIHHIVLVDRSNVAEIWIDGVQDTLSIQDNFLGTILNTTNTLKWGWHNSQATGGDLLPLLGVLDEVAIYDYALSGTQIANHYNAGEGIIINYIEDWENYALGAWVPASNGWTEQLPLGSESYTIRVAQGSWTSQHMRVQVSAIEIGFNSVYTYDAPGSSTLNGVLKCDTLVDNTTNNNTRSYFYLRWVDTNNYIQCIINPGLSTIYIQEVIGGVVNGTSVGAFVNFNVVWYCTVTLNGTSVVFDVYSDAARTTLLKSLSFVTAHLTPGHVGFGMHAGYNNDYTEWDNFIWTPA